MNKLGIIQKIFVCCIIAGTVSLAALTISRTFSAENGFTESLLKFIESNARKEEGRVIIQNVKNTDRVTADEDIGNVPLEYQKGDWNKYVIVPRYYITEEERSGKMYLQDSEEINMNTYGSYKLNTIYGKSSFTSGKYRRSDEDKPTSKIITDGLSFERQMQLHMEGNMGRRMKVFIDYDSQKQNNTYVMQYRAKDDNEVIREINAGEIDIKFGGSKYAVYDDTTSKGLGLDITLQKDNLKFKGFGSIIKGETEIELFRGGSAPGSIKLNDYQYVRNTYFQLEPYKRYDNLSSPPIPNPALYDTLITFTSRPADPENYKPYMVNISPSGFELYMDDQNPYNNYNATKLDIDGGFYDKLVSGADYTVNYSTGLITFTKNIPKNARIFAVYTIAGGASSSDLAVRTDVSNFTGRNFIFIKYGYSINEDIIIRNFSLDASEDQNKDGKLNLDIYEVRSFYNVGQKQLLENNFKIQFFKENGIMLRSDLSKTGKFLIDYSNGLISFYLREPFRELYAGDSIANILFSENQPLSSSNYTKYNIRIDYYREAKSFQLKHFNIVQGSVRITVNGRVIPSSLYTLDYTSGFLQFTDPNNPAIGSETIIEVKYEYLPLGAQSSSLVTGGRAEYTVNRNLKLGGTVLFNRKSAPGIIPRVGSEPDQTLVLEGDATLHMGEKSLKDLVKTVSGYNAESVPLEINAYAEYAKSIRKVNTFGKALIDDMESNEEITPISLSDKDWQLSSMPYNDLMVQFAENLRGRIFYYYYRDPNNPGHLYGPGFSASLIDYSQKPGPYNIATGHIADSIQSLSTQKSLAFNFNFSGGKEYIPVVTRQLAREAVDFSQLQYIEIWYRADGISAGDVELYFDIGSLNEDSDSDGILDTEDTNINGILDFDPSGGRSEDVGYRLNPTGGTETKVGSGPGLNSFTVGDGYMNTEDLNRNGILDTDEKRLRLPSSITSPTSAFVIQMNDYVWRSKRIYLDKSSADYQAALNTNEEILKKVQSIRLYLRNNGTASTGTIYIDSIKFVSNVWGNLMINDVLENNPNKFKLTLVDSINDSEYRANSFMLAQKETYTSLYGEKSDKDLSKQKESAIQIEYNLSSEKASATKKLTKPMDIRAYKTVNIWMNFRSFNSGDSVAILVGSSDTDYLEYRLPMSSAATWQNISLKLANGSAGNIEKYAVHGTPDLKRMSFIRVDVYGSGTGKFWLDDIYLSEAETQKDSAYWYEGEIKVKRPLFYTDSGKPVFSDINVKYIRKGHGSKFSTIGKPVSDVLEDYNEVFTSMNILPNWNTKIDFIVENSKTDSFNEQVPDNKRGKTGKKSLLFESNYISDIYGMPGIKFLYKQDIYNNLKEENISTKLIRRTKDEIHTPSIILDERLTDFLGGNLSSIIKMDLFFRNERISRDNTSDPLLKSEEEKRQKEGTSISLDYQNKYFFIQPAVFTGSHEIVESKGKTYKNDVQILSDVDGGFHLPLVYKNGTKFVDREKKANLKIGSSDKLVFSPNISAEFYYSENNFKDYTENDKLLAGDFTRAKSARSSVSNGLNLPFNFSNYKSLRFIRNLNIFYTRSVYFQETDVPYEGEGESVFDEEYGIKRVYSGLSNSVLNIVEYPPWYNFKGRGNFANGRDFAYHKFNNKLDETSNSPIGNYNNQLRLIDNAGINTMFDAGICIINLSGSINQVSERQLLSGTPQEVVSINANSNINFDLMQIFGTGFFRPNKFGMPHHSANLNLGYNFIRNMQITSNIEENSHVPALGITFKRDRSSLAIKGEYNYRQRNKKEYISLDDNKRDPKDDIYVANMSTLESFKDKDEGYKFSILVETDVQWLHKLFMYFYALTGYPIFSLEYSLILNRYDYSKTTSPEPYDQHLLTAKLTLDLHKNIQGGLTGRAALERFRDRKTNHINREIQSYEIALNFSLLF